MSDDLSGFSLYELFRTEAESQTAILTDGLLALERTGGAPEVIEPLMRAAHSLKGAARIVGLAPAESLAHSLEDVFVAAQQQKIVLGGEHVDVLLGSIDLLQEISRIDEGGGDAWSAANGNRLETHVQTLKAISLGNWQSEAKVSAGVSPGPPAPKPAEIDEPVSITEPNGLQQLTGHRPTDLPLAAEEGNPVFHASSIPAAPTDRAPPERSPASKRGNQSADPPELLDRVVRVSADNLSRLLGLTGESLVQARQLRPMVDSLLTLRDAQMHLSGLLQSLDQRLADIAQAPVGDLRERLVAARKQADRCLELLGQRAERLEDHARRSEDLAERLHHEVIASRLRPLQDGIRGFPRLVRDIARQLGKQVDFVVVGEQTGVDRDILERLEAPLSHLLRNALDHGIETAEERAARGKPRTATIQLEARHASGMLQIVLRDDGRGIEIERVRTRVVERRLANSAMAAQMAEPELLEFLFLPGFSTRSDVTTLSGRGVGLDVVQSMVKEVGGSVRVLTEAGKGTQFVLQLPITMSVIRALLVRIAGQPYAFPLARLESIQRIDRSAIETLEGRAFFPLDGQTVGLVPASQVLDLPAASSGENCLPVVVLSDRGTRFGVIVESFLGERDLDVRPVDPRLGKIPNISSVSVLEDGWPVLIVDVEDLVRSIDNLQQGRRFRLAESGGAATQERRAKRILVVDDSITVRELERHLLENQGYLVDVAVDGMDGWNAVRSVIYDLVVSDVDMPRMDGIELVARIKSEPRLRSLPVIIVSYKDREEDRIRGLDAGASSYLTKSSFHDQTFLETVADLIGESTI